MSTNSAVTSNHMFCSAFMNAGNEKPQCLYLLCSHDNLSKQELGQVSKVLFKVALIFVVFP